jgi:surface carbohydrate biosynthesis protein
MYFKIQNFFRDLSLKKFPKKTNILYFDYIDKYSSKIIIQNRDFDYIFGYKKRELNFFLILLIFINFNALKILFFENFTTAYAYMYIFFSRSKIVLTVGDNNLNFYRLKNYHKNIKFVAIQNGSRHRINDIFDFDHINNFNKKKKICSDLISSRE